MRSAGLAALLNAELPASRTTLLFVGNEEGSTAFVSREDRAASVLALDRRYLVSYRTKNRDLASGVTADVSQVVDSAMRWLDGSPLEQLAAAHPFVTFRALQLAYDRGEAKEFQWQALLADVEGSHRTYRDLVTLASHTPALRALYPHLGHRFALSQHEYSDDILVAVFFMRDGWFAILREGLPPEFAGDAPTMVDYLVRKVSGPDRR